jgi:polysaccharide pyruvyl transferase WcaK-like protein
MDATVIFVPHSTGPSAALDDRIVADRILSKLPDKSGVINIGGQYPASHLKAMASCCAMTIGSRLHFTIDALCNHVPSLLLTNVNDMRCHGIVGEMFGQKPRVLNMEDQTEISLIDAVERLWTQRDSVRRELESSMPQVVQACCSQGEKVAAILNQFQAGKR